MPKLRMWNGNAWNLVDTNAIQVGGKLVNLDGLDQGETLIYDQATDSFIAGIPPNRGGDVLAPLRSRQRLATATNVATINIPQYRPGIDLIFVFQNGMFIQEETEYDVLDTNEIQLKEGNWDANTLIEIEVRQISNSETDPALVANLQNQIKELKEQIAGLTAS